jgi:hypothetical protein
VNRPIGAHTRSGMERRRPREAPNWCVAHTLQSGVGARLFVAAQSNSRWTLPLPGATTDGVLSTRGGREGGVKRTFIMLQKRSSGEVRGWARLLLNEVKNWDRAATAPT